MKKLVYLLFFSLLIFNCSPEENNTDSKDNNTAPPTPTGNELEISHYITTTNLGNTYQYNFENFQQINTIKNSILTEYEFQYDSNGNLIKHIENSYGDISFSYNFNYDGSGKIVSVDEYTQSTILTGRNNYTRNLIYEGSTIKTTFPKNDSEVYQEEITLNADGLIEKYKRIDTDNSIDVEIDFIYDENENCTSLTSNSYNSFSDTYATYVYQFEYDNNPNPLYENISQNYLAHLILNLKRNFVGSYIALYIRAFGKNNITSMDCNVETQIQTYTNEYNNDGYPTKITLSNYLGTTTKEFYYN